MDTPKSVEVSRIVAFEFFSRCGQYQGTPSERKMQKRIIEAVTGHEDWTASDDPKGQYGFVFPEAEPAFLRRPSKELTREENEALGAFIQRQQEWLRESIFIPLDKKCRSFLWKTFYVPLFDGKMSPDDEKHMDRVAKVLGKSGALEDMRAEVEEWEDADDQEVEETPPGDN